MLCARSKLARKCSDSIEEEEEDPIRTERERDAELIVVDIFVTILTSQIQIWHRQRCRSKGEREHGLSLAGNDDQACGWFDQQGFRDRGAWQHWLLSQAAIVVLVSIIRIRSLSKLSGPEERGNPFVN